MDILLDIVVIFALSTLVNLIFSKLHFPTAVGYLLTGIVAGPYVLKLVKLGHDIEIMAEIGVILLLFTIGMEFSLKHLLKIRKIVFLGGFIQVMITAGAFYLASVFYHLDWKSGIFIGFITALSSSALVLKILQDRSELTSNYGRTVLGILIFQDLLLVPLLLFTNLLGTPNAHIGKEIAILTVKTIGIIALVFVGNRWLLPKLLHAIALTKNQELFMMSVLLICLAIALLTSSLGMSLAFGAFLAGIMISDSPYSHNAFGDLIPFKDVFTSFFFVSIGMLLNVHFVMEHWVLVLFSVFLVIGIKTFVAGGTGFLLGHTFKGTIMVGIALSQVGEFSFILAKIGNNLSLLNDYFYQLFIAVAVITMALTPFLIKGSGTLATQLMKLPLPKVLLRGLFPLREVFIPKMENHLVIIGKDPSAIKLSSMAHIQKLPHISVIFDPAMVKDKTEKGEAVIYGDATNAPILHKASIEFADIVVVSVGNSIAALAIIEKVRAMNKNVHIIARAKYIKDIEDFYRVGANHVLPEKFEIAIDMFDRVLHKRLYPQKEINRMVDEIRSIKLGESMEKEMRAKSSIIDELPNANIITVKVENHSPALGKTLKETNLRKQTGCTILAIKKSSGQIEHPSPDTRFEFNDVLFILGSAKQINQASDWFNEVSTITPIEAEKL